MSVGFCKGSGPVTQIIAVYPQNMLSAQRRQETRMVNGGLFCEMKFLSTLIEKKDAYQGIT